MWLCAICSFLWVCMSCQIFVIKGKVYLVCFSLFYFEVWTLVLFVNRGLVSPSVNRACGGWYFTLSYYFVMCENMVLKLRHCLAFCFERHLWVVTGMFCLWFLCDDWWSPALWRVLCFSLRRPYLVLTDESWTPPEAVILTQVLCWWFKCITLWYVGHVYGQRTALSLARCLTWSHALVWLRWFCLPWWRCHLCSSGPEGEGKLQSPLSAPRSLGAWLKCFVSEQPSHPQSLVLRKGKISLATIMHMPWCFIQNTSHLCWNKIKKKISMYSATFLLFCLSAILNPAITFFGTWGQQKQSMNTMLTYITFQVDILNLHIYQTD